MTAKHPGGSVARSSRLAVLLVATAYLGTFCPFYAVRHHFWVFLAVVPLFYMRKDFNDVSAMHSRDCSHAPNLDPFRFLGLCIVLIPLLFVICTWYHEFPWRGDYNFHFPHSQAISRVSWTKLVLVLWTLAGAAYVLFEKRRNTLATLLIVLSSVLVIAFEWQRPLPGDFARFPATSYVMQAPILWLCRLLTHGDTVNANRIFESLALPAWLLILRPLILRRRISVEMALLAAVLVIQADTLFYFAGAYLEPWSIVFCLLATEALLSNGDFRLALALVAVAALTKEQCIILLPFFALAAAAEYRLRLERIRILFWAIVCFAPFFSYYLYRRDAHVFRTVSVVPLSDLISPSRIHEWLFRVNLQFSLVGSTSLLILIVLSIVLVVHRRRRVLVPELILLLGALAVAGFFYFDRLSSIWTGYPRFQLVSFAIISAIAIHIGVHYRRLVIFAVLAVFVVAQVPRFVHIWSFVDQMESNFFEHFEAPISLPIRGLVRELKKVETKAAPLQVIDLTGLNVLSQFALGYPDISSHNQVMVQAKSIEDTRFEDPGVRPLWVIIPRVRLANLNAQSLAFNLHDHFSKQDIAIMRLKGEIQFGGGTWTEVRNRRGVIGYLAYFQ